MAYDEQLAEKIRGILAGRKGLTEKKMFGGIAFMLRGNMCCGVLNDDLILRLGPDQTEKALKRKHTKPFDVTGRPMRGFVVVTAEGCKRRQTLQRWLIDAADFAMSLSPKKK